MYVSDLEGYSNNIQEEIDKYYIKVFNKCESLSYSRYTGPGKDDNIYSEVYYDSELIIDNRVFELSDNHYYLFKYLPIPYYKEYMERGYVSIRPTYNKRTVFSSSASIDTIRFIFGLFNKIRKYSFFDQKQNSNYFKDSEYFDFIWKDRISQNKFNEAFSELNECMPNIEFKLHDNNNTEEFEKIYQLIIIGEQVNPNTLRDNLKKSVIQIAIHNEKIIGVAALKNKDEESVTKLFRKANVDDSYYLFFDETIKDFNKELGYCFILPEYRGIGILEHLISKLCKGVERIYATTGNPKMIKVLNKFQFKEIGNKWKGVYNDELSLFIFKVEYYINSMYKDFQ